MPRPLRVTILEGDETRAGTAGAEPPRGRVSLELELERFDLSLEHRRATGNQVVTDAALAMRRSGFGIKAATITPEGKDDVGSPNRPLREQVDGKVIVRTGCRITGITPLGGTYHPRRRSWGKDVANPMAMILAGAALLHHAPGEQADRASAAIYAAVLETLEAGVRTPDLGGHATTTGFTDAVIERVRGRLSGRRNGS